MPPGIDLRDARLKDGIPFTIYSTEALKAASDEEDGKTRKRIKGIASSTVRDLHGDYMERSALIDMEKAANDNMTIFVNHRYTVPEDVLGSVEKAVVRRKNDDDGEGNGFYHILDMTILVSESNDRAVKTWESIQEGTKLGLSIGAMIPKDGWSYDEEKEAFIIHHVYLLETSVVSIPANPRSWIDNAVKAIKAWQADEASDEEGDASIVLQGDVSALRAAAADTIGKFVAEQNEVIADEEPETAEEAAEVTESADEPTSQEAPEADPETEKGADPEPEDGAADLSLDDLDLTLLETATKGVQAVALTLAARLEQAIETLDAEKQARAQAEEQRDEALRMTSEVIKQVQLIVDRIAQTPAGRKTNFVDTKNEFDAMRGIYSERFLSLYSALGDK